MVASDGGIRRARAYTQTAQESRPPGLTRASNGLIDVREGRKLLVGTGGRLVGSVIFFTEWAGTKRAPSDVSESRVGVTRTKGPNMTFRRQGKGMEAQETGGRRRNSIAAAALAVAVTFFLAGCSGQPLSTREKGTLGGAGIGAATGAIIGAAVGAPGAGAAIGGALGGVTGFAVGNEMQNQEVQNQQTQQQLQQQQQQLEQQRQQIQQLQQQGETE